MDLCETRKLVIHKTMMLNDNPHVYTSLHIADDFSWEAKLSGKLLDQDSQMLCNLPRFVSTASEVGNVLSKLGDVAVCTGNKDEELVSLVACKGGKLFTRGSK